MNNVLRAAVAAVVVAGVALTSAGPASADNSNSNTNNNDVTNQGGDGVGAGAASGGGESTNWPPTDVSWPPSAVMNGDVGSKDKDNSAATPIVTPLGRDAPTTTPAPSTPETTKPIVPVGAGPG
jgi:hypothetical protein